MSTTIIMGLPGKRSVEQASQLLKTFYFVERELLRTLGGYLAAISNWELKKKLPKHTWQDSLRADMLRKRVLELRYPRRDVDQDHDQGLKNYLSRLIRCRNDVEFVEGVYFVTKQALCSAYEKYLSEADANDDAPTIEFMTPFILQIHRQLVEIQMIYEFLPKTINQDKEWEKALENYLLQLGGLLGGTKENASDRGTSIPKGLECPEYVPPRIPKRDKKFEHALFHQPPIPLDKEQTFIDRQVWLAISHVNEIWAAEVPGLLSWKWNDMPWEFYLDCARWAYDESRHVQMGEDRLKSFGFEIGVDVPIISEAYVSQYDRGEEAMLALLHGFECLAPAIKSSLKTEFENNGDTASSQDFDYDWADESIHMLYGHKWLSYRLNGDIDAVEEAKQEAIDHYFNWVAEQKKVWDYSPFTERIQRKTAEMVENRRYE